MILCDRIPRHNEDGCEIRVISGTGIEGNEGEYVSRGILTSLLRGRKVDRGDTRYATVFVYIVQGEGVFGPAGRQPDGEERRPFSKGETFSVDAAEGGSLY